MDRSIRVHCFCSVKPLRVRGPSVSSNTLVCSTSSTRAVLKRGRAAGRGLLFYIRFVHVLSKRMRVTENSEKGRRKKIQRKDPFEDGNWLGVS